MAQAQKAPLVDEFTDESGEVWELVKYEHVPERAAEEAARGRPSFYTRWLPKKRTKFSPDSGGVYFSECITEAELSEIRATAPIEDPASIQAAIDAFNARIEKMLDRNQELAD